MYAHTYHYEDVACPTFVLLVKLGSGEIGGKQNDQRIAERELWFEKIVSKYNSKSLGKLKFGIALVALGK